MINPPFNKGGPLIPFKKLTPCRGGTTRFTSPLCCAVSTFCANTGTDAATIKKSVRHDKTWAGLNKTMIETSSRQFSVRRNWSVAQGKTWVGLFPRNGSPLVSEVTLRERGLTRYS